MSEVEDEMVRRMKRRRTVQEFFHDTCSIQYNKLIFLRKGKGGLKAVSCIIGEDGREARCGKVTITKCSNLCEAHMRMPHKYMK